MATVEKLMVVTLCDGCGKPQDYPTTCLVCGDVFCYECRDAGKGKTYAHSVSCSGSGDGFYCNRCDAFAAANGDPLHASYLAIKRLRDSSEAFYVEHSRQSALATQECARLYKARKVSA